MHAPTRHPPVPLTIWCPFFRLLAALTHSHTHTPSRKTRPVFRSHVEPFYSTIRPFRYPSRPPIPPSSWPICGYRLYPIDFYLCCVYTLKNKKKTESFSLVLSTIYKIDGSDFEVWWTHALIFPLWVIFIVKA